MGTRCGIGDEQGRAAGDGRNAEGGDLGERDRTSAAAPTSPGGGFGDEGPELNNLLH